MENKILLKTLRLLCLLTVWGVTLYSVYLHSWSNLGYFWIGVMAMLVLRSADDVIKKD